MAYNTGSVALAILNRIDGISVTLSGELPSIASEQIALLNAQRGWNISASAIEDKYFPIIFNLTAAQSCNFMAAEGGDYSTISLGDFSQSKGSDSNIQSLGKYYQEQAEKAIISLSARSMFYKANG